MRRYVTIGGIVVATVLVGSAAAYAGPEVLVQRGASAMTAEQPDPTGSSAPTSSGSPASGATVAAVPCPAAAARVASTPSAAGTPAATTEPAAAAAPTTDPAPTSEPAPSTLPAPPVPSGGAFQTTPAKDVPDVPVAGGVGTEGRHDDGPGSGRDEASGHKAHHTTDSDDDDADRHHSGRHHSGRHDAGSLDSGWLDSGRQDGSGSDGPDQPEATPPATTPPATTDPAASDPVTPAPVTPAPAAPGDCVPSTGVPSTGVPSSGAPSTSDTSAATQHGWGAPSRVDNFDGPLDSSWGVYNGTGHNGAGRRTPDAIKVGNGIMTMTGDQQGNSGGMAWQPGQRYGRWEARVRSPAGDPDYHAVMLLWPDAENWPVGGEVDFMEISDPTRQNTQMFLHYGKDNQQVQGSVDIDATQWHDWAVEWAPTGITAYVDGKVWWSTKDVSILPPGPMHLCIQLDNFGGTNMKKTSMEVDWVKEYKLNPAGAAKAAGLVEGAAAVGKVVEQATRPLTEGAPDPVPAITGLVPNAVPAPRG